MKRKDDTYEMVVECMNCHKVVFVHFKKGESAEVQENQKCKYCGCDYFYAPRRPELKDYTRG